MTPNELSADRRDLLSQLMAEAGLADATASVIPRRAERAVAPLSFAQEVLWLLDRAAPGSAAYNTAVARRIRGQFDVAALDRAVCALVRRHDTLHCVFSAEHDVPVQTVLPAPHGGLQVHDLRGVAEAERESVAAARLQRIAETPFDLTREPPFRAVLAQLADDHGIVLLLTHHIASDAWSYSVMLGELSALYDAELRGQGGTLPEPPLQFGDFSAWQRELLQGDQLADRLEYWRTQLAALPTLDLPTDFGGNAAHDFAGACARRQLPPDLLDQLRALASANGATLYMVLLASLQTVLHRYSGQDDIVVGSAVAGRTRRETETMIGYFSQALPMRTRFDGDPTFTELLARVSDTVLGAFEHQDVPLEKLVLGLQRSQARSTPLFRVVLTMQDALTADLRIGTASVTVVDVEPRATKFDLTLLVSERNGALDLALWFRTALFEPATAERLLGHLESVLRGVVRDATQRISALPLLTAAERDALRGLRDTDAHVGTPATMVDLIAATVRQAPATAALIDGSRTMTYAELWAAADDVAARIASAGGGACVALALDRSMDAIVGLVGIWRAGAAYVPLSPGWPLARLAHVIAESGARVVVTSPERAGEAPDGVQAVFVGDGEQGSGAVRGSALRPGTTPSDLAYVLYTSGSTGTPKGVAVTHGNAVHYARGVSRILAAVPRDGTGAGFDELHGLQFALASSLSADLGNTTVFTSLCSGGTLHVLDERTTTEPAAFAAYLQRHPMDVIKLTPNHLAALVAGRDEATLRGALPRRWLVLGGEPLRAGLAHRLVQSGACRVLNHYGPTETTVGACTQIVTRELLDSLDAHGRDTVPIGAPLANTRAYVVDDAGNEQPIGAPGELVLAGGGVATGYLGRADLTRERFATGVVRDAAHERVYRTGDRVRRLPDGSLDFMGRLDDQVKVRGFRVELGEIEAVLARHPTVERAVVAVRGDSAGEPRLVGWIVPRLGGYAASHAERPTPESLMQWLEPRLPDYMVPRTLVLVEQLPLAPNGKVDRTALPDPEEQRDHTATRRAPATDTERAIAAIWSEVLKREAIGANESFLELGGQSLLAIRVLGKLSRSFGVRLPLRTMFDSPTIEQLAVAVETAVSAGAQS